MTDQERQMQRDTKALESIISTNALRVCLGGIYVLDGVDFHVPKGSVTGLVGLGGEGKTVLLKTLCGLMPISSGIVEVFGKRVSDGKEQDLAHVRAKVGFAFQNFALFDDLNVLQNVTYPLKRLGHSSDEQERAAREHLQAVGLWEMVHLFPSSLSGGMRRRVAIARATVSRPALALHDDPTAGLDPVNTARIISLLSALHVNEPNSTAVVVSHDPDLLLSLCDRIAVLSRGKILIQGPTETVSAHPHPLVRRILQRPTINFVKDPSGHDPIKGKPGAPLPSPQTGDKAPKKTAHKGGQPQ